MGGNRFDPNIGVRVDEANSLFGALNTAVSRLEDTTIKTTGQPLTLPEIDFTVPATFRRDTKRKGGVFVTLTFKGPGAMGMLDVYLCRTADRTSQAAFKAARFSFLISDIQADEQAILGAGGNFSREIFVRLEYGTQYDVYRLVAYPSADSDPSAGQPNPSGQIQFDTPAYYQFTTPAAFGAPSDPSLSLIISPRGFDASTRAFDVLDTFRQYAPLSDSGAAQSYRVANVNEVYFEIQDPDGKTHKPGGVLNDTELDQVDPASTPVNRGFFDRTLYKEIPAGSYSWLRNVAWANGQKTQSSGAAVPYKGGGFSNDPTNLISVSLTIDSSTEPYTPKSVGIDFNYTEPATRVALKNVTVRRKIQGSSDATYKTIIKKFSLKDDEYTTVGAHVVHIGEAIVFKPSKTYTLEVTINGIENVQKVFTQDFSTGVQPDVPTDTVVPSSLGAPILTFVPRQGLHITGMTVGANYNQPLHKYLVVTDNAGLFLDLPNFFASQTHATVATEALGKYDIGTGKNKDTIDIKLKKLVILFGSVNLYAYFIAENPIGSTSSSLSVALDLATGQDIMGGNEAVRIVDVATGLRSPGNVLGNGAWKFVDNATDQQQNWARWDGFTTPLPAIGGAGYKAVTSTSNEIAYVKSTHSGWLKSGSIWMLVQNIKDRYDPGESHAIYILMRAGASVTVTVKLHIFNLARPALTGTMNLTSTTACVGTGTLALTEMAVGDQIVASGQKRTVATITDNTHWTVTSAFTAASGATNIIIDNIEDTASQSIALTTSNQIFGARIKMKDSPSLASTAGGTDYASHQFGLEITGNSQDIYYYNFMDTRGSDIMAYAPRGSEGDAAGLSVLTPTFVAAPDIVTAGIVGAQGGWQALNRSGIISAL